MITPYVQPGTSAPAPPTFNFAHSESSSMAFLNTNFHFSGYSVPTRYIQPADKYPGDSHIR